MKPERFDTQPDGVYGDVDAWIETPRTLAQILKALQAERTQIERERVYIEGVQAKIAMDHLGIHRERWRARQMLYRRGRYMQWQARGWCVGLLALTGVLLWVAAPWWVIGVEMVVMLYQAWQGWRPLPPAPGDG